VARRGGIAAARASRADARGAPRRQHAHRRRRGLPYQGPLFTRIAREAIELEAQLACAGAQRLAAPAFSRSYFVPLAKASASR